ncbi:MAG: alanine racemase [Atribacterota bacterium]
MMENILNSTWLEIDLDAVRLNIKNIKKHIGKQIKIMGIVKGNGYGHDAVEISKIILEQGVEQLAVARIEEAIFLRKNNIQAPILVLGTALPEQFKSYIDYQVMASISDLNDVFRFNDLASKLNKKINLHLKIDTGMGRLGIKPKDIKEFYNNSGDKLSNTEIVGIFTHFSTADENDKSYTYHQFRIFMEIVGFIKDTNVSPMPCFHTANSGAILDLPETWLDMVRPGCLIYGLYPSDEVKRTIELYPALSFKSRITFIKKIPIGSFVGYGKTFETKRETTVATLPVGYADGYPRTLSNSGQVLIRGELAPVIGRVCMDQMMVDITDINNVAIGEEVVLWGAQGNGNLSVQDIAKKINTIVDVIIHLTDKARVAKIFIKKGNPWKIKNILGEHYF